jgi:hypothetical protein
VSRIRGGRRGRQRVVIGKRDTSLTGVSGMVAVTEMEAKLGLVRALDGQAGSIKERDRGLRPVSR